MNKIKDISKTFSTSANDQKKNQPDDLIRKKVFVELPQGFATGPVMGRFLRGLKEKRILSIKDPVTGNHLLPPREVCAKTRVLSEEWEEVGPEGVIVDIDIAYYASPDPMTGKSRATPYTVVNIKLDGTKGTDTFWHELKETDPQVVKKGLRVRPVWNEHRTGSINDIKYFEIIGAK